MNVKRNKWNTSAIGTAVHDTSKTLKGNWARTSALSFFTVWFMWSVRTCIQMSGSTCGCGIRRPLVHEELHKLHFKRWFRETLGLLWGAGGESVPAQSLSRYNKGWSESYNLRPWGHREKQKRPDEGTFDQWIYAKEICAGHDGLPQAQWRFCQQSELVWNIDQDLGGCIQQRHSVLALHSAQWEHLAIEFLHEHSLPSGLIRLYQEPDGAVG